MHDIKYIRAHPEKFNAGMKKRGLDIQAEEILAIDLAVRDLKTKVQTHQQQVNDLSKQIGILKSKAGDTAEIAELIAQVEFAKSQMAELNTDLSDRENALHEYLITIPNLLSDEVPFGIDESYNVCVKTHGTPKQFDFQPKQHFELGEALDMMDFEQTAKISGSRFVTLKNTLARLERALVNFMLDIHTTECGYIEMSTPFMVRESTMYGIGQLPKFAEDSFVVDNSAYRLIPTAEVTLTSMVADMILDEAELPIRMTGHTPCFRSEAGSAGRDTRGMIRLHQFSKVELVSIVKPEDSYNEHERMLNAAETVLRRLEIPYRVMLLCSQDTGFCSAKTYDIEAWLPGQNTYREISSCSNCHGFQALRMKARYKTQNGNEFLHTLNGSGLPIGRTIVAIMENYQNADGSITIPGALVSYMGGIEKIQTIVN
jgi:seryl-tRNA synthetase